MRTLTASSLPFVVVHLKRFLLICAVSAVAMTAFCIALVPVARTFVAAGHGKAAPLDLDPLPERSLVFDRDGKLLSTLHAEENRSPVLLSGVPMLVRQAIMAVEDENFYFHSGVNLRATLRAFFANVEQGGVEQGGSTITMQLVKNALLTPERKLSRKVQEAVLAQRLEQQYSKDQILERYLNTVYFGNGAYGVQAAAEMYFSKDVSKLDWPEAAMLASLIRDPNGYDPFSHPKLAVERRRIALLRLVETGQLTKAQAERYSTKPLPRQPNRVAEPPKDYWVEAVKQLLLTDPKYKLGDTYAERYNALFKGGLRVTTTLDSGMQTKAMQARTDTLPDHNANGLFVISNTSSASLANCPKLHDAAGHCEGTVAMVAVEPSNGAVRAVVGGPGFTNWKYNLALDAQRQPGSAMKPFVLVTALEHGGSVLDTIDGGKCSFVNNGGTPNPYVVPGEGGVANLIRQLAGSVNCAFLRLGAYVGADKVVDQARKMGVTAPLSPNLSLPLGSSPISPLEMAGAYASIANDGVYNAPYFVSRITDSKGDVIYDHTGDPRRVMSQETAREATVAMTAVVTGGTATRARLSGRVAAGKTGTTQKHGDAWFVGFTPQLTTAVWMGSPEAQIPLANVGGINVFGGTFPALLWHNFMTNALEGQDVLNFTPPSYAGVVPKFLKNEKGVELFAYDPFTVTTTTAGSTTSTVKKPTTTTTTVPRTTVPPTTAPTTTAPPTTVPPTTGPPTTQGGP